LDELRKVLAPIPVRFCDAPTVRIVAIAVVGYKVGCKVGDILRFAEGAEVVGIAVGLDV